MGQGGENERGLAGDFNRLERRCCVWKEKTVTSFLQWVPKALFATGGIFVLLGSVLVGLGSMESVKYPQGLPVGIPLLFFGIVFLILCVVALVVRHKRESKGIGIRTFDSYSKEALNLSLAASYSSSALSSPRAVQYYAPNKPNARSSIEAVIPEERNVAQSSQPKHFKAMTGTPINTEGAITDTGTGFYYVADVTNPKAGYYVHSETGDTYHVNETTGEYYLVDQNADNNSTIGTFSRMSSFSSYQNSSRPTSAVMRPGSALSRGTTMSPTPTEEPPQRRIRPSSSVGRRQQTVKFRSNVTVTETDKNNKTSQFRQKLREEGKEKPRPKIFTDPFGDDDLTFRTRPQSSRPRTGRARSGVRRSQEPADDNVITAEVHVHAGNDRNSHTVNEDEEGNVIPMSNAHRPSVTKIYVQSEGKNPKRDMSKNAGDVDSSLGNSISSIPRGRTKSLDSNLSMTTQNRFSENFEVRA